MILLIVLGLALFTCSSCSIEEILHINSNLRFVNNVEEIEVGSVSFSKFVNGDKNTIIS